MLTSVLQKQKGISLPLLPEIFQPKSCVQHACQNPSWTQAPCMCRLWKAVFEKDASKATLSVGFWFHPSIASLNNNFLQPLLILFSSTHSGEKPYKCSQPGCEKRFADRSNMILHNRLHSGVKPFACNLCPKRFSKKHHLGELSRELSRAFQKFFS